MTAAPTDINSLIAHRRAALSAGGVDALIAQRRAALAAQAPTGSTGIAFGVPGNPGQTFAAPPGMALAPDRPEPQRGILGDIAVGLDRVPADIVRQVGGAYGIAGQILPGALGERFAQSSTEALAQAATMDRDSAFPGQPQTLAGKAARTITGMLPAVGAGLATGGLGGLALAVGGAGVQEGGGAYADALERLGPGSEGVAATEGAAMGVFSAGTSLIPFGQFLGRVAPNAVSRAVSKLTANRRFAELMAGAAAEGGQEMGEEGWQMILQRVAEDDPEAFQGAGQRFKEAGILGALGGGVVQGATDVARRSIAAGSRGTLAAQTTRPQSPAPVPAGPAPTTQEIPRTSRPAGEAVSVASENGTPLVRLPPDVATMVAEAEGRLRGAPVEQPDPAALMAQLGITGQAPAPPRAAPATPQTLSDLLGAPAVPAVDPRRDAVARLLAAQDRFRAEMEALAQAQPAQRPQAVQSDAPPGPTPPAQGYTSAADIASESQAPAPPAASPTPPAVASSVASEEGTRDLSKRYKPGNPFAERANRARETYIRLSRPSARDEAMARSFPLGAGFGRKGDERRMDATINRATRAVQALKDAEYYEAQASAFDAGEITAQGRRITEGLIERSEKREKYQKTRSERVQKALELRGDKERWQVPGSVWADSTNNLGGGARALILGEHREAVERAIAEGKPVPAEVLAEYNAPDLTSLTVPQLREEAARLGIDSKGGKKALVDRLTAQRAAPPAAGTSPPTNASESAPKTEIEAPQRSTLDVAPESRQPSDLSSLTVPQLRAEAARRGLPTTGGAKVLRDRLQASPRPTSEEGTGTPPSSAEPRTPESRSPAQSESQAAPPGGQSPRSVPTPSTAEASGSSEKGTTARMVKDMGVSKFLYEKHDIADNTAVGLFKDAIAQIPDELNIDDVLVMAKNIARMDRRPAVDGASMAEAIMYRSIKGARQYAAEMDASAQEKAASGRKYQLAEDGGSLAGQRARKIIGDPAFSPPTPPAKAEPAAREPSEERLSEVGLLRKFGDRWQYKTSPEGRWYFSNTQEGAAEQARAAYLRTPPEQRLTASQRFDKANADNFASMDATYGRMSLDELKSLLDEAGGVRGLPVEREFTGTGTRRSGVAMANQGARDAGEFALKMRVYLKERVEKALREGRPVPARVLADYPDLAPKAAPNSPATPDSSRDDIMARIAKVAKPISSENDPLVLDDIATRLDGLADGADRMGRIDAVNSARHDARKAREKAVGIRHLQRLSKYAPPQSPGSPAAEPAQGTIFAKLDAIEAKAKDRIKKRTIPRGRGTGAETLIADSLDAAVIVAVRALKVGIKGGRALTKLVAEVRAEFPKIASADPARIRRVAVAIIKQAKGDLANIETAIRDVRGVAAAPRPTQVKATVRAATGLTPDEKTVTEPEALRAGLSKAAKAAKGAFREGAREARAAALAEMQAKIDALKDRQEFNAAIRSEVVDFVKEYAPTAEQGAFLTAASSAKNTADLARVMDRVARHVVRSDARALGRLAARLASWKSTGRFLYPDERREMRQHAAVARGYLQQVRAADQTTAQLDDAKNALQRVVDDMRAIRQEAMIRRAENAAHKRAMRETLAEAAVRELAEGAKPMKRADGTTEAPDMTLGMRVRRGLSDLQGSLAYLTGRANSILERRLYNDMTDAESAHHAQHRDDLAELGTIAKQTGSKSLAEMMRRWTDSLGKGQTETVKVRAGGKDWDVSLTDWLDLVMIDSQTRPKLFKAGFNWTGDQDGPVVRIRPKEWLKARADFEARFPGFIGKVKGLIGRRFGPAAEVAYRLNGWYPRVVGADYWRRRRNNRKSEDAGLPRGVTEIPRRFLENLGLLQERTEDAKTPFLVGQGLEGVIEHLDNVSKLTHLAEPTRAATAILYHPDVRGEVSKRIGGLGWKMLETHLAESSLTNESGGAGDFWARVVRDLNRNRAVAALATSVRSMLRNLGGTFRAMNFMEPAVLLDGLTHLRGVSLRELSAKSGYFWHRYHAGGFSRFSPVISEIGTVDDASIGDALRGIAKNIKAVGNVGPKNAVVGAYINWQQLGQYFMRIYNAVDGVISRAVYMGFRRQAAKLHPDWSAAKLDDWAVTRAERVIRQSQNPSSAADMTHTALAVRRSGAGLFTLFTSDNQKANTAIRRQWSIGGKRAGSRAVLLELLNRAWGYGAVAALDLGLIAMIRAALAGDEDELDKELEKYAKRAPRDFARMTVETAVPIGGIYAMNAVDVLTGGSNGRIFETPVADSLENGTRAAAALYRHMTDEKYRPKVSAAEQAWRFTVAAGEVAGDPTVGIRRMVRQMIPSD